MSSLIVEVCKINNVHKHPNADKLSLAECKGWQVVVGLDQYKDGDLVVFIPPDCMIPPILIEKYNLEYLKHNGRTGTVKLRGELSQGLVIDIPEGNFKVGDNVADILEITKYEVPEPTYSTKSGGQVSKKKLNPLFDKYTDIENIKNFKDIFKEGDEVVVTEKIHGSNSRFGNLEISLNANGNKIEYIISWIKKNILHQTHEFVVGSHNVQKTFFTNKKHYYSKDVWNEMATKYNLKDKLIEDTIVYGEIYGEGIQDLTYGVKGIDLLIFDVKWKGEYLNWNTVVEWCKLMDLKTVPVLYVGKYYDGLLEEYTSGKSIICPTQMREGVVIKALQESRDPRIGRKILKSVSPDYLLRKNGTEYQ